MHDCHYSDHISAIKAICGMFPNQIMLDVLTTSCCTSGNSRQVDNPAAHLCNRLSCLAGVACMARLVGIWYQLHGWGTSRSCTPCWASGARRLCGPAYRILCTETSSTTWTVPMQNAQALTCRRCHRPACCLLSLPRGGLHGCQLASCDRQAPIVSSVACYCWLAWRLPESTARCVIKQPAGQTYAGGPLWASVIVCQHLMGNCWTMCRCWARRKEHWKRDTLADARAS